MPGLLTKLFITAIGGTRNDRIIRGKMKFVTEHVNPLEQRMRELTDEQMLVFSDELRSCIAKGAGRDEVKAEAFALIREASWRALNIRQFDVQLVAGMVLDEGWIAEEATGEGKTFACYPAIFMAVLEGMHVHVVTVNDYLVERDAGFARKVFDMLGVTVGFITAGMNNAQRKSQYACNITYGTNSEFGFDYLRDNTKMSVEEQVQSSLDFAIIDEVDNILIDEARTPLIISGPAYGQTDRYRKADAVARELINRNRSWDHADKQVESLKRTIRSLEGELSKAKNDAIQAKLNDAQAQLDQAERQRDRETKYYEVELDRKSAHMTHEGVTAAQDIAGVGSFYVGANMEWPHLMDQALRAHLVYEKDKDYVSQEGSIIIVDEFTGRLMEGRQWSDGLHQAVEAKERVPIKEENQTMATVTIQNYFKLYKKLAGMTGTAMTEAVEFLKIYNLEVAAVPTHRPVNRVDHEDRIYATIDAKYDSLVEEINEYSKMGRPILVGTTSIEKSEKLSTMLVHRYGIEHQVLNARPENAAREAEIVAQAGRQRPLKAGSKKMVGTVTIATNMAGRGTDIKLGEGVVYDKCRVPSAEKFAELGLDVEDFFPPGSNKCCIHCPQYDPITNCKHCFKPKLDPDFPLRGRTQCRSTVPCGVHIVGTERHEARRIDNQLRGRAGRQGDPGSSRFFLSLRDELMAIFAGQWTLKVLGWLGLQGNAAIEDKRISKGIGRAQRKVEERNFEIRKNLLEYDEVMDHQRKIFYSMRQQVLEGRNLEGMVMEMIEQVVDRAVDSYLSPGYAQRCIAEWAGKALQIPVDAEHIHSQGPDDLPALEADLRNRAKEDAGNTITMTIGEYMDEELTQKEWDLRGLSSWAMSRFGVNFSQGQLRKMNPNEVESALIEAAAERIDEIELSGLGRFLESDFPQTALAEWASETFAIQVQPGQIDFDAGNASQMIMDLVRAEYLKREIEYPVDYAIGMTIGRAGADNVYALGNLAEWANTKYDAGLAVDDLRNAPEHEIRRRLVEMARQWTTGGKLEQAIQNGIGSNPAPEAAVEFAMRRFDTELKAEDLDGDALAAVTSAGRKFLRREMTELERFVLLQIFDSSWIDHLQAMTNLKDGIGLRSFAQQDPRVAYKSEGASLFLEALDGIRSKVSDMIFKVRLSAGEKAVSQYNLTDTVHEQLSGYDHLAQDMAERQAAAAPQRPQTIRRDIPRVGRNDPCPCGSGRKYKKCCGKTL